MTSFPLISCISISPYSNSGLQYNEWSTVVFQTLFSSKLFKQITGSAHGRLMTQCRLLYYNPGDNQRVATQAEHQGVPLVAILHNILLQTTDRSPPPNTHQSWTCKLLVNILGSEQHRNICIRGGVISSMNLWIKFSTFRARKNPSPRVAAPRDPLNTVINNTVYISIWIVNFQG